MTRPRGEPPLDPPECLGCGCELSPCTLASLCPDCQEDDDYRREEDARYTEAEDWEESEP